MSSMSKAVWLWLNPGSLMKAQARLELVYFWLDPTLGQTKDFFTFSLTKRNLLLEDENWTIFQLQVTSVMSQVWKVPKFRQVVVVG